MPQRRTGISTTEEAAWYAREPEAEFEPQRRSGLRRLALFVSGATVVAGLALIAVIFFAGSPSARAGRKLAVAQARPQESVAAAAPAAPTPAAAVAPVVTAQVTTAPVEPSAQPEAAPEPIEAKPQTTALGGSPAETDAPASKPADSQIKRSAKHARTNGKKPSPTRRPAHHGHLSEVR